MVHIVNPLDSPEVQQNAALICELTGNAPVKLAITLGSGVGQLANALTATKCLAYTELQGFPQPTVSGHKGELIFGYLQQVPVLLLNGREHYYESGNTKAMKIPLRSLKAAGVENILLTNAAGSLRSEVGPGSVMLITDHIFFSISNPLIGEQGDNRFVDMTQAYDAGHINALRAAATKTGVCLHEGVYMWFAGPNFETPAERRMAQLLGADAVGMSTAPETIIARHCGLKVAALSVITSLGAGMEKSLLSHEHTLAMAAKAIEDIKKLMAEFIRRIDA